MKKKLVSVATAVALVTGTATTVAPEAHAESGSAGAELSSEVGQGIVVIALLAAFMAWYGWNNPNNPNGRFAYMHQG